MKMSCAAQYLLAAYASVPNISRHFNYITCAHEYLSSGFFFIIFFIIIFVADAVVSRRIVFFLVLLLFFVFLTGALLCVDCV